MGKGWVWLIASLCTVSVLEASGEFLNVPLEPHARALLDHEYEIAVVVTPHPGDAWTRLAKRFAGDAGQWELLATLNRLGPNLTSEQKVRIPFSMLKPSVRVKVLTALFPADRRLTEGWSHKIVASNGVEGEPLWKIAEWFTGNSDNYARIRERGSGLSTRPDEVVLISRALLTPALAATLPQPSGPQQEKAAVASSVVDVKTENRDELDRGRRKEARAQRKSGDDEMEESTHLDVEVPASPAQPEMKSIPLPPGQMFPEPSGPGGKPLVLEYARSDGQAYAIYHLKKGEALYSSVAIRFTGRVYSEDVGDVLDTIVKFNSIADVARIPEEYPVRIPLELLLPKYLPPNDPRRRLHDQAERESARLARRVGAKNLKGVHVIIDSGHGGRDAGTTHDGIWESVYVYDVACRLKRELEKKSGAVVTMTTRSPSSGYQVPERGVLDRTRDHLVLTSPPYHMGDSAVGVNLRWYLANSVYRKALRKGTPEEKVVFLSIHADSLHPSLRGAMIYVPGERYILGSFSRSDGVYLARKEVRESPSVSQNKEEALLAEGLSKELADSVVAAFTRTNLRVHPFNPVRDNVFRGGREWVPAIIRYNKIPTRLLLEVCNLGNEEDRSLIKTRKYRQDLAVAIHEGLAAFFEDREEPVAIRAAAGK